MPWECVTLCYAVLLCCDKMYASMQKKTLELEVPLVSFAGVYSAVGIPVQLQLTIFQLLAGSFLGLQLVHFAGCSMGYTLPYTLPYALLR